MDSSNESVQIDREYIDNFSVKKFVQNDLIDKYFSDIDVNMRTVGTVGYTSELVSNISEDAFNTGSVLFREAFPNRAQLDESIYSHAAIFQLDATMSNAAACKFLFLLDEDAILNNMTVGEAGTNRNKFYYYINKDTTFYVEDMPFTLDYDIEITVVKKISDSGETYLYTARYVTEEYTNSLSAITSPYIKVRTSSNGVVGLEVWTHQVVREVVEDIIVSNSEVNYPTIDLSLDTDMIAGFDIIIKEPGSSEWEQMKPVINYSQPLKTPFCYYQMIRRNKIRLSFNTKDTYYIPEFNTEIKVIIYKTLGAAGNFDTYNADVIVSGPVDDPYGYNISSMIGARSIGASQGGMDQETMEGLKAKTLEGYRTANAITTESDLQEFFNNYKYRYGSSDILFIKKRDDVYERVFSAYMIAKNNGEIYKTSTLDLNINLYDMNNIERNMFIIDPGTVFTCNDSATEAKFYRNIEREAELYDQYLIDVENGDAQYIPESEINHDDVPVYLDRPCSFAEWKSRKGYDTNKMVWDLTDEDYENDDSPIEGKFLIINPFLIKFTKSPNLVSTYLTYVDNQVALDFTDTNSDMYVQFVIYQLSLHRKFEKDKKYVVSCGVSPSINVSDLDHPIIQLNAPIEEIDYQNPYVLGDPYVVDQNDLRVILAVMDKQRKNMLCFSEMIPTEYDARTNNITFTSNLFTDDHITSTGNLRLLQDTIYRNKEEGYYYKVHKNDNTRYTKYDKDGNVLEDDVISNVVTELINNGTLYRHDNIVNTFVYNDVVVPVDDVELKVFTLYKKNYSEDVGQLVDNTTTNNPFADYGYENYIWTNEYSSSSEPVVFMKSLESVRSYLDFKDFTDATYDDDHNVVWTNDIMDVEMRSISFLRASTVKNEESMDYFFRMFYSHYINLQDITDNKLRNETGIDLKFYRTYGRSTNYLIGEDMEILDTVNVRIKFDMWFVSGTDLLYAVPEVKQFIKDTIETVNDVGMNSIYISNLMRKIEEQFAFVDHIRFRGINAYSPTYQAVKNANNDINTLTVEERRWYVPELLTIDLDDIIITEYTVS